MGGAPHALWQATVPPAGRPHQGSFPVDDVALLEVLDEAVDAVRAALDAVVDWGPAGTGPGQYRLTWRPTAPRFRCSTAPAWRAVRRVGGHR